MLSNLWVSWVFLPLATAFPGPSHLHPSIHFTPDVVSDKGGWHDIAGALTHKGVHHIYQGTGWNHAFSKDLVHWASGPHGPKAIHETYHGMDSTSDPCSGFITKDDKGTVCAGFRQCGSRKGVDGGHDWDVPLELRCALDDDMGAWSEEPDYLFNVSWYRAIPYDPARPWKERDDNWYVLLSMDACNSTTQQLPCSGGGQLHMWRSPVLRGDAAKWEHLGPVLTSNATVLAAGHTSKEFVTIDYIGKLQGDPSPAGDTRLFFNNVGGNGGGDGCCSGTTSYFVVRQEGPGANMKEIAPQQMVDWGAFSPLPHPPEGAMGVERLSGMGTRGFSMARTLGSEEADQVSKPGRRVMIGWTGPGLSDLGNQGSAQSLPRDLSLGADFALRQRFVPELQMLRGKRSDGPRARVGLQAEVLATFSYESPGVPGDFGVSIYGDGNSSTRITLSLATGLVTVDATQQGNPAIRAGPLPKSIEPGASWSLHAILDHSILELIVNDVTALVVYVSPPPGATDVEIFGVGHGQDVRGEMSAWVLASANNLQTQGIVV